MRRAEVSARTLAAACAPVFFFAALLLVVDPHSRKHLAYIGPGAGFAFLESLLTLVISFFASLFSILLWPARMLFRTLRRSRRLSKARVGKLIFLGLDGLDPAVTEKLLAEGKLPNLARLRDSGSYRRLRTTYPALSPVAWSTFATGVNPGKHNIFDFLNRDLALLRAGAVLGESPAAGPRAAYREMADSVVAPIGRDAAQEPAVLENPRLARRRMHHPARPDYVPPGALRRPPAVGDVHAGSARHAGNLHAVYHRRGPNRLTPVDARFDGRFDGSFEGSLEGPENDLVEGAGPLRIPFRLIRVSGAWKLEIQDASYSLDRGEYTPWVRLRFRTGRGIAVRGIARFLLTRDEPELSLYVTPVQIDPVHPALPISRPQYYAMLSGEAARLFRDVGHGRGYLGAQRGRDRS